MPSNLRVPCILFEDVPAELRREPHYFAPCDVSPSGSRVPPPAEERCLARARGDTGIAAGKVPWRGGHQCLIRRTGDEGLCTKHWRAADEHTRFRAAEIVRLR